METNATEYVTIYVEDDSEPRKRVQTVDGRPINIYEIKQISIRTVNTRSDIPKDADRNPTEGKTD